MDDNYQDIEDQLDYEKYQEKLQGQLKYSHSIGVNLTKFKEEVSKHVDVSSFDEDMWVFDFESWVDWLSTVREDYQTVREFIKEYYV